MTRKRKRQQARKQKPKQQRRAEIARKRKERGWKPPHARSSRPPDEVVQDMMPLFPRAGGTSAPSDASMEQLMMTLLASHDLVEEPEFETIIVDPMRCVDTFVEVAEAHGIDPDAFSQLPDEEREMTHMELLERTARRLLTDDLRQDIVDALNQLRLRLKKAGKRDKTARAAALQSFLSGNEGREMWSMIGLVQAIVQRSLAAGFELLEVTTEAMEAGHLEGSETPLTLFEKLPQSSLGQKADKLLRKVPGLRSHLEKKVDNIWEEGVEAIFTGDLYLGLYTPEELEVGMDIFNTTMGDLIKEKAGAQESKPIAIPEDKSKTLISGIDDHITRLFTPARLDQLRQHLNSIVNDKDLPEEWLAFMLMLVRYMEDEEAVENEKHFLISTFLGEMRAVAAALEEERDEQE